MEKRKKVWIVTYNFHPVWAGPAERFLRYYKGFTERNLEVEYITAHREDLPEEETYRGAKVRRIKSPDQELMNIKTFVDQAGKLAMEAAEKPDAFVVLLGDLFNSSIIRKLSGSGIKTIYVNTMIYEPSQSGNPLRRLASHFLNKRFFNAYDQIVCSTSTLKEAVMQLNIKPEKIHVISNGVILDRFKPLKTPEAVTALRKELGLPLDEKIALFVGLRVERKGVIDLVEAWKLYKSKGGAGYLALVGGEQRENPLFKSFYKKWDELLKTVKASDQILNLPPSKKIEQFFQACDFFVFLSKKEGMPNVLTEAMATGCPLITTRFDGFSDTWGRDGKELLLIERKIPVIAEAIRKMMEDQDLYNQIRANAIEHVKTHHDVNVSLDRYAKLF